ncbi:AraC family transcriptional regulator [Chitinophaga pendula]|uniref:helix-turn-helix domain-containing protein n=1 Tax=Chitinophaga TaxID=79328 RepID=UPI000BAFDE77|nr:MULTISPECIES: AraC family transcriptional regulator [Chitinophaga]ASZ11064.1 AraC family transcriptional regulator [Chitinophaga sp. MD30]UCJ05938.1 AraC family transcriptional regulator [Chitinophaga pendula]
MQKSNEQGIMQQITYSCYYTTSRVGEQFVADHVLTYVVSGTLRVNDGDQESYIGAGEFRFARRNRLGKFVKLPPEGGGAFKSISVHLRQEALRNFSMEYGYAATQRVGTDEVIDLPATPALQHYIKSLEPYMAQPDGWSEGLLSLKVNEAILLLINTAPRLRDVLFDFTTPGKIDLEAFMQQRFRFNVDLKRFAYLTGRSLATFKRDFEKIFHTSPSRWLQQRRLQEARYLIKEKGMRPSDVYLEVGFENFSHFSYAFKQYFGHNPSSLLMPPGHMDHLITSV